MPVTFQTTFPAPSDLTVTNNGPSSTTLNWNDNTTAEDGYSIERAEAGGTFSEIATVAPDVTTYTDTDLTASTYTYRVRGYISTSYSEYSNEAGARFATGEKASTTTSPTEPVGTTSTQSPATPTGVGTTVRTVDPETWIDYTEPIAETGSVLLSGNPASIPNAADSASITFNRLYRNPVVVAFIPTNNGGQDIDVRVTNVTSSGCDIFTHEPDNEAHNDEWVTYLVAEEGVYKTLDGVAIEVGRHTTEYSVEDGEEFTGDRVPFVHNWDTTPAVFCTPNTHNNADWATVGLDSIYPTGFNVGQQRGGSTATTNEVDYEELGYIAIEPGTGEIDGTPFEVGITSSESASFSAFSEKPDVLVEAQTRTGTDTGWARGDGATWTASGLTWQFESSSEGQTYAYAAFSPDAAIEGYPTAPGSSGTLRYISPDEYPATGDGYAGTGDTSNGGSYSGTRESISGIRDSTTAVTASMFPDPSTATVTVTATAAEATAAGLGLTGTAATVVTPEITTTPVGATGFSVDPVIHTTVDATLDGALLSPKLGAGESATTGEGTENKFHNVAYYNADTETLGPHDGFQYVGYADSRDNDSWEDVFTGRIHQSDFPDFAGPDQYVYLAFAFRGNSLPRWEREGTWLRKPPADPDNYQLYVLRSDGENDRTEYFRIYYSNSEDTAWGYVADPYVWLGRDGAPTDAEIVGTETDRTVKPVFRPPTAVMESVGGAETGAVADSEIASIGTTTRTPSVTVDARADGAVAATSMAPDGAAGVTTAAGDGDVAAFQATEIGGNGATEAHSAPQITDISTDSGVGTGWTNTKPRGSRPESAVIPSFGAADTETLGNGEISAISAESEVSGPETATFGAGSVSDAATSTKRARASVTVRASRASAALSPTVPAVIRSVTAGSVTYLTATGRGVLPSTATVTIGANDRALANPRMSEPVTATGADAAVHGSSVSVRESAPSTATVADTDPAPLSTATEAGTGTTTVTAAAGVTATEAAPNAGVGTTQTDAVGGQSSGAVGPLTASVVARAVPVADQPRAALAASSAACETATAGGGLLAVTASPSVPGVFRESSGGSVTAMAATLPAGTGIAASETDAELTRSRTAGFGADVATGTVTIASNDNALTNPVVATPGTAVVADCEPEAIDSLGKSLLDPLTATNATPDPTPITLTVFPGAGYTATDAGGVAAFTALPEPGQTDTSTKAGGERGYFDVTALLVDGIGAITASADSPAVVDLTTIEAPSTAAGVGGSPQTVVVTTAIADGPTIRTPGLDPNVTTGAIVYDETNAAAGESTGASTPDFGVVIDEYTTDFIPDE